MTILGTHCDLVKCLHHEQKVLSQKLIIMWDKMHTLSLGIIHNVLSTSKIKIVFSKYKPFS